MSTGAALQAFVQLGLRFVADRREVVDIRHEREIRADRWLIRVRRKTRPRSIGKVIRQTDRVRRSPPWAVGRNDDRLTNGEPRGELITVVELVAFGPFSYHVFYFVNAGNGLMVRHMGTLRHAAQRPSVLRRYRKRAVYGQVTCGDALDFLSALEPGCADLIFLDPPFNLKKVYSRRRPHLDSLEHNDYAIWLQGVLHASAKALAVGGTLYLYHLPIWAMRAGQFLETRLQFQHWIAISMKNGFVRGPKLYPAHYSLLMFSKGTPRHLHRPRLRPKACRHCGKLVKDYGGYRQIIEAKGINLSDVWEDLSPVRHASKKFRKANELPQELFRRIIHVSGFRGGLYVDPFAGSGSGAVIACEAGMHFKACDLLEENCKVIIDRLDRLPLTRGAIAHES